MLYYFLKTHKNFLEAIQNKVIKNYILFYFLFYSVDSKKEYDYHPRTSYSFFLRLFLNIFLDIQKNES